MNGAERLERDNRIMRRHELGATNKAIAEQMGITTRQVQRVIVAGKEATDRDTSTLGREFSSDEVDPYDRIHDLVDQICDAQASSVRIVRRHGNLLSDQLGVNIAEDLCEQGRTELHELVEACRRMGNKS